MNKYKVGQRVCVSIKELYDREEVLSFGNIVPDFDEFGDKQYYDLYNEEGILACCDGEACIIKEVTENYLVLMNSEGESSVLFKLTTEEADKSIFIL